MDLNGILRCLIGTMVFPEPSQPFTYDPLWLLGKCAIPRIFFTVCKQAFLVNLQSASPHPHNTNLTEFLLSLVFLLPSSFLRWQALFTPPLRADPLEVSVLPSVALFCNGISHHCCLNLKSHASPTKMIVLSGGYLCEWTLIFGHIFVIDSGRMPFVPSLLLCFSSQVRVRHWRYFNVFYVAF